MTKRNTRRLLVGELSARRILKSVLFIVVCIVMFSLSCADKMIFYPPRASYEDSADLIKIEVADGERIAAMHYENPAAEYTILFSHGNAEDMGQNRPFFEMLVNHGYSVFAYDYRGYGRSDGKPSEKNTYRDIEAAWDYLTGELKVPAGRVIILGRSVGAAPSIYLAAKTQPAGLICESPFTSAFRVVTKRKILPFDKFDNLARIEKVTCPILVIHGEADTVVAPWHGRKVYEKANDPKMHFWVEDADHNDLLWRAGETYFEKLEEFTEFIETHNSQ